MHPGTDHPIRLLWKRPDGQVSVDILSGKVKDVDAVVARFKRERPTWEYAGQVHRDNLPGRRLRNAWRVNGTKLEVDLPAGRELHLAELREERNKRLAETDGEATRELERGRPDQALANHRQALRDLPAVAAAELEQITDVTELENWTPTWPQRG